MTTTVPLTADVLATISRAVRDLGLPAPCRTAIDGQRVDLGFRSRSEVDAWQRYIGLPPAITLPTHEYGAIDFYNNGGGWCGARVITCRTEVSADAAT